MLRIQKILVGGFALGTIVFFLTGCGQTGALYLPGAPSVAPTSTPLPKSP